MVNEEVAGPITAPITLAERIPSLDVLRGFALLGILPPNMMSFAGSPMITHSIPLDVATPRPHHAWDMALLMIEWIFMEGKMRTLFAALFGASSVLLLNRIEARAGAGKAADIWHRRMMWMMLFGLIHLLLIWEGDILLLYSILALLALYPVRNVAPRRLIGWGMAMAIILGTAGLVNMTRVYDVVPIAVLQEEARAAIVDHRVPTPAQAAAVAEAGAERQKLIAEAPKKAADARVSYLQSMPRNAASGADFMARTFTAGFIFDILGPMIAGMGLYKIGFLSGRLSNRTYVATAIVGYAVTIPIVLTGLLHAAAFDFSRAITRLWTLPLYQVACVAAMLANASLILLAVKHRVGLPAQLGLAAVGRMAFTNYIGTSLIAQLLFSWGPWKLYGSLEYYQQVYFILAIWAVNIVGSLIWLRLFAFGPLEWLWRSLTYWKPQPWRTIA